MRLNEKLLKAEIEDFEKRINDIELDLVEAKEYTHLSSEALLIFQGQINDMKELIGEFLAKSVSSSESDIKINLPYEYC